MRDLGRTHLETLSGRVGIAFAVDVTQRTVALTVELFCNKTKYILGCNIEPFVIRCCGPMAIFVY